MGTAEIIAVTVVGVIAAAEIFCLYLCSKHKKKSYPLCAVIPLYAEDKELFHRLGHIGSLIEDGDTFISHILLIDYGCTDEQLEVCSEFCRRYHAAELAAPEDIEEYMSNYISKSSLI